MATILKTKSLYFNDTVLLPKPGVVKSRKDVLDEKYKIIISPMTAIIGETFITEAAKLGFSIALPRFIDVDKKVKLYGLFERSRVSEGQLCFVSVGMNETESDLKALVKSHSVDWLVDVASGYIPQWKDVVKNLKYYLGDNLRNLMVGNVVTTEGVTYLIKNVKEYCDNLFIRVGIGNGKNCQTSDVTGFNRGQITELMECSESEMYRAYEENCFLVSDGGIDRGGYCLKAWGAGASYVLMGGYFSTALEAETNISGDGTYFGCASDKQNQLAGLDKHSEGKVNTINKEKLQPLANLVKELWGGISSGISYSGYKSISEFVGNGVFEEKSNSLPPKIRY